MGQPQKSAKGEISITNFEGRIRLRWRLNGERYSLNLPFAYCPENMHYANVKVAEIKLDIMKGGFDSSLEKYRYLAPAKTETRRIKPRTEPVQAEKVSYIQHLVLEFNKWGKNIRNVEVDQSVDYLYIRKWLAKQINIPIDQITERLNNEAWAATTYNRRLAYLNIFFTWLVGAGKVDTNPLKNVCKKRDKGKKKNPRRKPLEEHEIASLLKAIGQDTFCPASSRFKHSFYYPFLAFIFHTGVRNAEAIGLRVKHVDFDNRQIEISETFARTVKGTNHAARIKKGTKMGNTRYLPLTEELIHILLPQVQNKEQDDFVFTSPKGLSIDDKMLERRMLKPVMMKLGFGNRDLYAARHSFGTRAVQQGIVVTDVAYLMGHSTIETTIRNYVGVNKRNVTLPNMAI